MGNTHRSILISQDKSFTQQSNTCQTSEKSFRCSNGLESDLARKKTTASAPRWKISNSKLGQTIFASGAKYFAESMISTLRKGSLQNSLLMRLNRRLKKEEQRGSTSSVSGSHRTCYRDGLNCHWLSRSIFCRRGRSNIYLQETWRQWWTLNQNLRVRKSICWRRRS